MKNARKNSGFKPNYSKLKGTITIKIFENCQTLEVSNSSDNPVTYQEVIGALEIVRLNLVMAQTKKNKRGKST